jgi:hypothetical protein
VQNRIIRKILVLIDFGTHWKRGVDKIPERLEMF